FFSSRRRHTRLQGDWSSDVCSSDLSKRIDIPITGAFSSNHNETPSILAVGSVSTMTYRIPASLKIRGTLRAPSGDESRGFNSVRASLTDAGEYFFTSVCLAICFTLYSHAICAAVASPSTSV